MEETKLRAVMVGCGGISGAWLDALREMPDVEIVGLVDLNEDTARQRAEQYELKQAVIDHDLPVVLDDTAPDVVFNCTVPGAHHDVTLTALRAGAHVLGEKPLANSVKEAQEMVEAADQSDRIFAVIQNRRYQPALRRLRRFLASGRIGRVTTVNSDFYIGAHFGGFRDHMKHVLLVDMAIHTFDAARYISAADATSVYCHEWNPSGSWYDHDASAIAIFEMTDDIVYSYRGSWCSEGCNTSWESSWRIVGTQGSVLWDGYDGFDIQVVDETGDFFSQLEDVAMLPLSEDDRVGGHAGVIREFLDCVRSDQTPETIGSDNIKSLAMVFGAVDSAESGEKVAIDVYGTDRE
jgi:predicted dehydrogenase